MRPVKEIIQQIVPMIWRFIPQWRLYGFSIAFWTILFPLHHVFKCFRPYLGAKKHGTILKYLLERYGDVVNGFTNKNTGEESFISPESTIWVCWWDGEDAMPALVKVCYNTLRQRAGKHPVQLVTKYNFREFVSFPEYILEKVNAGIITVTHFSNMLRANLLYEYGGIWMDATILVLQDISLENLRFYTLKAPGRSASVSSARFAGLSNPAARLVDVNPQTSRWSGFLLAGTRHAVIFEYMRDILYAYWKDHDDQIDYLLYDFTIALGYDNIPIIKEMIDDVPCSSVEKFELEKNMNVEFTDEKFAYFAQTPFHKLTWKKKFNLFTKKGKPTIYAYILKNMRV